jgi:hypothetical protein
MKLFWITLLLCCKAHCETQVFEAIARYEGRVVYLERHTVVYDDQTIIKSLTEYQDAHGKPFGSLRSDFTRSLAAPEYIFRDNRQQSLQGQRWANQKLEVFSQERKQARVVKKDLIKTPEVMIGGEGLIYYIGAHLKELIGSDGMDFKFVIPGRLSAFDFFIKPLEHNATEAAFEVKMKSWLMGLFGPRLKLIYDLQKKRVISFEGLSNVRNSDGSMMSVDVQYVYEN